jgi:hypothetical protein
MGKSPNGGYQRAIVKRLETKVTAILVAVSSVKSAVAN